MNDLQENDFQRSEGMLKKAEILGEKDARLQATTANNLACLYRKQGKLHVALQYLQKALNIEARLEGITTAADTHLNTCAVLSQMNRHASALQVTNLLPFFSVLCMCFPLLAMTWTNLTSKNYLPSFLMENVKQHAQSALILLQEELFGGSQPRTGDQPPPADRLVVMAICYHNIGVEHEFAGKYEHALQAYRKGVSIAETHLGSEHTVAQTLKRSLRAAKKVAESRVGASRGPKEKKQHNFVAHNKSQTRFTPAKNNPHSPQSQLGNAYRTDQGPIDFDFTRFASIHVALRFHHCISTGKMLRKNGSRMLPPVKGALTQSASSPLIEGSHSSPVSRKDKV
jgi:tetratricopeptide (TPR) repeat protein